MNPIPHRQYRFADFLLDETRGALLRDDKEIPLRKQAYEMLLLLVEHQGELVDRDFLMDAIWSDAVVTENSLTQCLKEIRRAIGDENLTMIRTVPKRGYVFDLPVERIETGAKSATVTRSTWFPGAVAIVAIASIGALAWWALGHVQPEEATISAAATPPPANSLAVLPFTNMSSDPEVSFLADGVSEEILNQMAQIPNLLVIARTSSFTFRDSDDDIASIGRQLNVAHVLEGSVRVEADTARVTAQLVRTDDQTHLWSQSYDRQLDSIFELQKGIAQDVAQQLHVTLVDAGDGIAQGGHKPDAEAYEAYLRGQYLMAQRTPETMAGAVDEFSKATDLDPDYAAAHANLAITTRLMSQMPYGGLPSHETLERARPHAKRALELAPELAEAHAAMAYTLVAPEEQDQAFYHFQRAVSLNPNYADGAIWLADALVTKGQYKEAFALLERAVRSDPLSVVSMWMYFVALQARGRLEEAGKVLEKLASLSPDYHRQLLVILHGQSGQWAEAALTTLKGMLEDPGDSWLDATFAIWLAAMGLDENALAMTHAKDHVLSELLGRPHDTVAEYEQIQNDRTLKNFQKWNFGEALAATGDFERALPYLEDHWIYVDGVIATPWFDAKSALALIDARRASGEDPETEVLVAALQDNARRYREAGIVECLIVSFCVDFEIAIADYLSGDRETAVNLLSSAVSSGYKIPPNVAYLQFLYDDPDMTPVFERQRDHVLAQRREFLQAICPDNPYADVWQPLEGTCDM